MPERWSLTGDWINSCSCDSGCPCLFYSDPTQGHCDSMDAFHIRKGKFGRVALDGLNIVLMGKAPGNFWKGNWIGAAYFDKRADEKQRKAIETIFGGKVGGPPAILASLISEMKGSKYSEVKINARDISVSVPGVLEYQLKPSEGGNKKKPIQVANHPFSPAMAPMNMGIGIKSHYKDYGIEFDNTGKDGNWADFIFKGP
jgi:hypothetical protein